MPRRSAADADIAPINAAASRLRPPPDLTASEKKLWVDVVASCPPTHFRESDQQVLTVFVRACLRQRAATSELNASGYITDEGRLNPMVSVLKDAERSVAVYSRLLKLNPVGRQQSAQPAEEPLDYFAREALLREGRSNDLDAN